MRLTRVQEQLLETTMQVFAPLRPPSLQIRCHTCEPRSHAFGAPLLPGKMTESRQLAKHKVAQLAKRVCQCHIVFQPRVHVAREGAPERVLGKGRAPDGCPGLVKVGETELAIGIGCLAILSNCFAEMLPWRLQECSRASTV